MRSVWFSYNGEPLEEKSSDLIENKHLDLFKDQLVPNLISNEESIFLLFFVLT